MSAPAPLVEKDRRRIVAQRNSLESFFYELLSFVQFDFTKAQRIVLPV